MSSPEAQARSVRAVPRITRGATALALGARARFWLFALALVVAHVSLVQYFMPIRHVFSDRPIHGVDYDLHIGQVFRVAESLDRWGKAWSYDVQLLAGQPEGTITDSGSKGWELWTFALMKLGVPRAIAYNLFVLLVMWSCPLLIFFAARTFELSAGTSLLAASMASCLWFFDSHLHWIWFVGMISWCGAACLSLLILGLFQRWLRDPHWLRALAWGLSLGVSLLVHPYTFFALAAPMGVLYLRAAKRLRAPDHGALIAMVAFSLAVNAYWLHNAWLHWHYILDSAVYAQAHPTFLFSDLFDLLRSGSDTGVIGTRTGFRWLCVFLAIAGLVGWRRERDACWLPLICAIVPLFLISYLSEFLPGLQQTQPYRQITPAMLFCTLPAAAYVTHLHEAKVWASVPRQFRFALLGGAVLLGLQLFATQVLYFFPALVSEPNPPADRGLIGLNKYGYPWPARNPSHALYAVPHSALIEFGAPGVIRWLEKHLAPGARILVEGSVMGERLAWGSGFEVLGGFFERNLEHVDANYFRGHRGREIDRAEFVHYAQTYAVEWVVKDRPDFEKLAGVLKREAIVNGRHIYRNLLPVTRMLEGSGEISASTNSIRVRGSAPDQSLLLSYHWHEALRCRPNCKVERAKIDIDRVGFVRVPAPHPADLEVWNSYETW